jgi:hypothetical protein
VDDAKATISALPLATGGFLSYEFRPVGSSSRSAG